MGVQQLTVDIEVTNRCNARCNFCPREATPHQGLMTPDTFAQCIQRAKELVPFAREVLGLDVQISLSGLGEPLLNPHAADFVRLATEAGLTCQMSSNGSLADENRARALIDAGLARMFFNVGDRDDDYERVYQLPFERTYRNVVRFKELAGRRCKVFAVLVNHRHNREHMHEMRAFWKEAGISAFIEFDFINRGGALFVDHMQFESLPELAEARTLLQQDGRTPLCAAPFRFLFVGYDGQYYLCCSDWEKKTPLSSVFDASFLDVTRQKLQHVKSREPVCKTCVVDPYNRLTEELRAMHAGDSNAEDVQDLVEMLGLHTDLVNDLVRRVDNAAAVPGTAKPKKRLRRLAVLLNDAGAKQQSMRAKRG